VVQIFFSGLSRLRVGCVRSQGHGRVLLGFSDRRWLGALSADGCGVYLESRSDEFQEVDKAGGSAEMAGRE
jgi:hypothetical protein